jgi:hypothetical protein
MMSFSATVDPLPRLPMMEMYLLGPFKSLDFIVVAKIDKKISTANVLVMS